MQSKVAVIQSKVAVLQSKVAVLQSKGCCNTKQGCCNTKQGCCNTKQGCCIQSKVAVLQSKGCFITKQRLLSSSIDAPYTYARMHYLMNWTHIKHTHLWYWCIVPGFCLFALFTMQGGFPVRMKSMYHFQEPHLIDGLFAVVKPFLSQKMKERVSTCPID